MIRIVITAAAYEAILVGRSPDDVVEAQRSPDGGYCLWLLKPLMDRLTAARAPGESYSDAIVRLASESAE